MTIPLDLAVIPGDGIGPEVISQALDTLAVAAAGELTISTTDYPLGAGHYLRTGEVLLDETLTRLSQHDAILLGAVGGDPRDSRLAGGIIERGLLLKLRFGLDHYVNMRPTELLPGVRSPLASPGVIDFVVIREGTEGPYIGNGGVLRAGTPEEVANELSVNTAYGVERVVKFAFEKAEMRRRRLTLVHKTNVLVHAGALWSRCVREVATKYPDVEVEYLHVDAATITMITNPAHFDVIVTDNLFGDILTDLAGAVGGGIGLAGSSNLDPTRRFPSMFEPVHGSAPDIAGHGVADPTAAIMSTAMMMDFMGQSEIANRIASAVRLDRLKNGGESVHRSTQEVGLGIRSCL